MMCSRRIGFALAGAVETGRRRIEARKSRFSDDFGKVAQRHDEAPWNCDEGGGELQSAASPSIGTWIG